MSFKIACFSRTSKYRVYLLVCLFHFTSSAERKNIVSTASRQIIPQIISTNIEQKPQTCNGLGMVFDRDALSPHPITKSVHSSNKD